MKKRKKLKLNKLDILLIMILIIIALLIFTLFSYAYFKVNLSKNQSPTTVQNDLECIDVTLSETGLISLNKNYPVTDNYAIQNFTPITITLTNNCPNPVDYSLTVSSLYLKNDNYINDYISDDKIRVSLKKSVNGSIFTDVNTISYLSELSNTNLTTPYIDNYYKTSDNYLNYTVNKSYQLDNFTVNSNDNIVYNIYLWIDYYEGAPNRIASDEYNNSTQGKKFKASTALTLNVKDN